MSWESSLLHLKLGGNLLHEVGFMLLATVVIKFFMQPVIWEEMLRALRRKARFCAAIPSQDKKGSQFPSHHLMFLQFVPLVCSQEHCPAVRQGI